MKKDEREMNILAQIGAVKGALQIDNKELARRTGIPYRTLMNRIGKDGHIGNMRLYEYWAIQDTARKGGYR